jgi:hypothetical protein
MVFFEAGLYPRLSWNSKVLLPQPPQCWDYRHATTHAFAHVSIILRFSPIMSLGCLLALDSVIRYLLAVDYFLCYAKAF